MAYQLPLASFTVAPERESPFIGYPRDLFVGVSRIRHTFEPKEPPTSQALRTVTLLGPSELSFTFRFG